MALHNAPRSKRVIANLRTKLVLYRENIHMQRKVIGIALNEFKMIAKFTKRTDRSPNESASGIAIGWRVTKIRFAIN